MRGGNKLRMATHQIQIKRFEDYKTCFGDKYCTPNKEIADDFQNDIFEFHFCSSLMDPQIKEGYMKILSKYTQMDFNTVIDIQIETTADYCFFFSLVSVTQEGFLVSKDHYRNCRYHFHISIPEDGLDELLIHNYLMIFLRSKGLSLRLSITDTMLQDNDVNGNEFRIATYICGCNDELISSIDYNGKKILFKARQFGKIIPAVPINKEIYAFLCTPLDDKWLDSILNTSEHLIPEELRKEGTKVQLLNTFIRYLFWRKFEGHQSFPYQKVRELVFQSVDFKKQAKHMPFLALLIFAQYDYYYRSSIVKEYKQRLKMKGIEKPDKLRVSDVVEELQQDQEYDRYAVGREMLRERMDIKSLLRFKCGSENDSRLLKKKNLDSKFDDICRSIKLHEVIVSEMFEAAAIAEGMLQLIENSVIHANGGLLSLRIREFIKGPTPDRDTLLLTKSYPDLKKNWSRQRTGKEFYLEMKLSDFSAYNMKEKFIDNAINRTEAGSSLQHLHELIESFQDETDLKNGIYSLFFNPSPEEREFWREYYKESSNQVHHYGLQIFDSILKARNGSLCVSGYGDVYNTSLDVQEWDKDMPGTSYRILLPLCHDRFASKNIIVDTCADQLMTRRDLLKYIDPSHTDVNQLNIRDSFRWETIDQSNKEKTVESFAKELKVLCKTRVCLVVIPLDKMIADANRNKIHITEETIIKGVLLFLLKQKEVLPVTIIGLTPEVLLEITRIIALFYDKRGDTTETMEKIQIYLRGTSLGDEILFAGSNINQTADRITRLALTRGNSSEYITIAQSLLNRSEN